MKVTKYTRLLSCRHWTFLGTFCTVVVLYILWTNGLHTPPLDTGHRPSSPKVHPMTPKGTGFHWLGGVNLNLTQRLSVYNQDISAVRQTILSVRGEADWHPLSTEVKVLWCNNDSFMEELEAYRQVQTVVLPWQLINHSQGSRRGNEQTLPGEEDTVEVGQSTRDRGWTSLVDKANVVVQKYYTWIASEPLCIWIHTPGFTKARWDAVYNRSCQTDTKLAFPSRSLEVLYLYGKPINPSHYWPNDGRAYPSYFYTDIPDRVLYLHLIQDSIVTDYGDILSGNLKLVPYSCSQDTGPDPPQGYENTPIWNEVFVITQFWGDAFFHKMLEVLPRIAPYLEFLQTHKHIKVHVPESGGYTRSSLKLLGVGPERLISGVCRAKLVYLPQATACGFTQVQEIQLLSQHYRGHINTWGVGPRHLVVLIQRTGHRRFKLWEEIAFIVEKISSEYGLEYALFPDNPSPPLEQAMVTFNQAVMIVAPHGAGLANMVYSEPGTFVIEGVCNPPHVNMCFQWTAHVLGHRYHGIPSREGCEDYIDIEPQVVGFVMRMYLEQIKSLTLDKVMD